MRRTAFLLLAVAFLGGCAAADARVRATESQQPAGQSEEPAPGTEEQPAPGTTDETATPPPVESVDPDVDDCRPDELTPTDTGVGDPLFPDTGNPDVDVERYDIDLTVDHEGMSSRIAGTVGIDLRVAEDRAAITLDADGPEVSAVTVDGEPAEFTQEGPELRITPASAFEAGRTIRVEVAYEATPSPQVGADRLDVGWFTTPGGTHVLNEPDGASSWLPSNDHPSDKATYRFTLRVPDGVTAVANGGLISSDGNVWVWQEDLPMATYQIQVLTGDYEIVEDTGPGGLELLHVVLAQDREAMQPLIDATSEQIEFFEQWFGRYPLDRYGLAITDSASGLAMETFGRSLFSRDDVSGAQGDYLTELLLSHELAHQWFGNAVTLGRWQDIWLNEAFATYAQWMWFDHRGLTPIDQAAGIALMSRPPIATGDPRAEDLFSYNSYDGGAVVLHALRRTIGDEAFFTVMRQWVEQFAGESCTTGGFVELAEAVSGQDLGEFFDEWLYAGVVPSEFPS